VIALSALALEVCVRLLGIAEPLAREYALFASDPVLPYRTAPGLTLRGRSATDEYDFEFRHNRRGFRDEDHILTKPAGVFRILGLGDSFTYGAGADYEETYLRRLEKRLNQGRHGGATTCEVIKCGIPRFFPEPERILLEHEGLEYDPDLILVAFVPNDIMDTYMGVQSVVVDDSGYLRRWEARRVGTAGVFLYRHSHVFRLLFRKHLDRQVKKRFTIDWAEVFKASGIYEDAWRKVEAEYDQMVRIAGEAGIPIALLYLPVEPAAVDHYQIEDPSYPASRLKRWASGRRVPFIDSAPALAEASKEAQVFWTKDGHCTPRGYGVIAEVVYESLLANGLVPRETE